ncbi:LysR substrate-binding domain-containing protein [Achromobacter aloeverae]
MRSSNTFPLQRMPSLRSLLVFDTVARHLNQVRAAESLSLTQSALSRQIKALEDHLGVALFERNSRGLKFTQEGELLYDFTRRSFELLNEGLGRLVLDFERQTLVVSAARSYAERVLAPRLGDFVRAHPWIDVRIDVHRYYADIEASGADISVRLGDGNWPGYDALRLSEDGLIPVCAPAVAQALRGGRPGDVAGHLVFRNVERDYVEQWNRCNAQAAFVNEHAVLKFNDSTTLLSALEAGQGVTVARMSLVADALARGVLVRLWSGEARDDLDYYAISAQRTAHRSATVLFMEWLRETLIRPRAGA